MELKDNDLAIHELLLHLPVQSLLRFRSVCKSWCNMIDSSYFRNSHIEKQLKNNKDDEALFLQISKLELSILKADNGQLHNGFPVFKKFLNDNIGSCKTEKCLFVVGPVNGLICMYKKTPYIRSKRLSSLSIAIYNPCLDEIKILPVSPMCLSLGRRYLKKGCFRDIGFGFDSVTKDYKLVQLIIFPVSGTTYVEVYSGRTNTWRELVPNSTLSFMYSIQGIKSKSSSSAHWRIQRRTGQCILSFDMQREVFETILYPNFDVRACEVFAKDDDSIALFVCTCDFRTVEVWELASGDKKRGWSHVRDVNVEPVMHGLNPIWPTALWKRDGLVLMESDLYERCLIFYDYCTEDVRMCCEIPNVDTEILHYEGSLISP